MGGNLTLSSGVYATLMDVRQTIAVVASAVAISTPFQASACAGADFTHLFEERPAADVLPGAEIIRVRFSNVQPRQNHWPIDDGNHDGGLLRKVYVGSAHLVGDQTTDADVFPVYATANSCTRFFNRRRIIEGEYFLIGRFQYENGARRFYAGGNVREIWVF